MNSLISGICIALSFFLQPVEDKVIYTTKLSFEKQDKIRVSYKLTKGETDAYSSFNADYSQKLFPKVESDVLFRYAEDVNYLCYSSDLRYKFSDLSAGVLFQWVGQHPEHGLLVKYKRSGNINALVSRFKYSFSSTISTSNLKDFHHQEEVRLKFDLGLVANLDAYADFAVDNIEDYPTNRPYISFGITADIPNFKNE